MIAEYINNQWVCNGEVVNPYQWQFRCHHEDKWRGFQTIEEMNNFLNELDVSEESEKEGQSN